ncbi:MAG: CCA tRNA nucleotidyltransferase [Chloroflexaceae bacterium]|nr:CCA tRNA nucleotidyltransferase [Chloroflexaceae bacterium]
MVNTAAPPFTLAQLPPDLQHVLLTCVRVAAMQGVQFWLVGGVVRDLLQQRGPTRDLDLAYAGDAPQLCADLAAALGATLVAEHGAFGTATLAVPMPNAAPPLLLDLARTRREQYPQPASLPHVSPADIVTDLGRRDFSVNAMAVPLGLIDANPPTLGLGGLLDPHGGVADLHTRRLRLLHAHSLRDDPTRVLRGVRLAVRMDMHFTPDTRAQISDMLAQGYLHQLSPERIRNELCLALEEPDPAGCLALADQLGLLPQLAPERAWNPARAADVRHARQYNDPLLVAGAVLWDCTPAARLGLGRHYRLDGAALRLLTELDTLQPLLPTLHAPLANSYLDALLHRYQPRTLQLAILCDGAARPQLEHYLHTLRLRRPHLNGHDLHRLGVPPGKLLGQLLAELRVAVLDGQVTTRAEEVAWAQAQVAALTGAGVPPTEPH